VSGSSTPTGFDENESDDADPDGGKPDRLREEGASHCVTSHDGENGQQCNPAEREVELTGYGTVDPLRDLFEGDPGGPRDEHRESCSGRLRSDPSGGDERTRSDEEGNGDAKRVR
jgi:hypothetical protein